MINKYSFGKYVPEPSIASNTYSPIVAKDPGASFTGNTVALNETLVESIPPFSVPPSSLTVT